jgi:NADH-quinone oxidoreductase subunit M
MDALASLPHLVSWVIFLPAAGAVVAMLVRSDDAVRWTALVFTTLTFLLSLGLWFGFDPAVSTAAAPQLAERSGAWLPGMETSYFVGIDGLNLLLVLLTTMLGPLVILASWTYIEKAQKGYYALMLLLQTGVTGVFCAFDLFLFYVFFEITLIPMYFIIGIWGGEQRVYAAIKFVMYTLVGSLLMLVGVLWLGFLAGESAGVGFTTDWYRLVAYGAPVGAQWGLFFLFFLAFAIKVPLFPFHTWLPDAHVQAPTGGSVVLAGTLLKMGTYGLLRFTLPFFPNAAIVLAPYVAVLAVIGIIYGALVAFAQTDAKKLVAYSSVSHLGFVVLGLFALTAEAGQGALIQMVNHGISTGALFLLIGMLYERRHTRDMAAYGGIAKSVPVLTFFMMLSVFASAGLPGLNGFVGEFLILLGSFGSRTVWGPVLVPIATTGVILAAVYLLWMVYRTFFGEVTDERNATMRDLNGRELAVMIPLAILMIWLGMGPAPFLARSEGAVRAVVEQTRGKAAALTAAGPDESVTFPLRWPSMPAPVAAAPAHPAAAHAP